MAFRDLNFAEASVYFEKLMESFRQERHQFVPLSSDQFNSAWQMRLKYDDKPDISFVDFTSMVVMQELGITQVFTGDRHFEQVNLGFELLP